MENKNITITITLDKGTDMLNDETTTLSDSLHEALCLAIHEGNEDALDWLMDNVINIDIK